MSFMLAAVLVVRLPLVVQTYGSAGVPAAVLAHAQERAAAAFAAVGIHPVWRPCPVKNVQDCVVKPKSREMGAEIRRRLSAPRSAP